MDGGSGHRRGHSARAGFRPLAESRLFEMKGNDPAVLVGAVAVIAAVALFAGYLPARRAGSIHPMEALKNE